MLENSPHTFGQVACDGARDAAATIQELSRRLGLHERDVCQAAGVPLRTYLGWKKPGDASHPRVADHERLWALLQFTDDLEELLDSSAEAWFRAAAQRRRWLRAGRFGDLLEILWASSRPTRDTTYSAGHRFLSVGTHDLDEDSDLAPPVVRSSATRIVAAQTVQAARRRGR